VDPREDGISSWALEGRKFSLLGRASRGSSVTTDVLAGINIDPGEIFDRADR
jgi:hypothetical protein